MSKIDKVKEILNTLRVALSLAFGMLVFIVGAVIKRYDQNKVDYLFYTGIAFVVFILISVLIIVRMLSKRTNEIGEL